ncbi:MAG TPA: sigma-70 family RNA polymerase sigma factor [Flavobacteriia bacterium]|nr:sigma-70 family RNA polymerase sigma factor [Flavobacteriia bacterium]
MEKKPHADYKYIEALVKNDTRVLNELYQKYSGKIVSFILKNNGDYDDAQDIIQETLITIFNQAKERNFVLTCPFDAYFYLLCKRKWLNKLNKKGIEKVTIIEEITSISDEQEIIANETIIFEQKSALMLEKLKELGGKCKELIEMTFKIKKMEEVAKQLGVTYGYARKKKSECLGKLTKMIKNSSVYNQLKNS